MVAALIICAAYGATAITIWAIEMARRRARRGYRSILQHLIAAGAQQDQLRLAARLGRELSPMQLFALAPVGGFIAGRKLPK